MTLLDNHMPLIILTARRVAAKSPPSISVDDLIQEGAAKLVQIGEKVNGWSTPFVATTLRHVMIDHLREQYGHSKYMADYDVNFVEDKKGNPLAILLDKERRELAAKALSHLTDRQRQVVEMKWLDELKLADIGDAFGLTEGRISQINHKAVRLMRREIFN